METLIMLLNTLLTNAANVSTLLGTLHTEGRQPTAAELDALAAESASASGDLRAAIAKARAEGR